jgi:hypothetical protein
VRIKWSKFVAAMTEEFPILERLCLKFVEDGRMTLPGTFRAPKLRHLQLRSLLSVFSPAYLSAALCSSSCLPSRPPIDASMYRFASLPLMYFHLVL